MFSTERDGIRASVSLERNPLPSGQATWLTASVTNMGSDDVVWFHGGCRTVAIVSGSVGGVRFRLGRGHDALGATFKLRVLREQGIPDGVPIVVFTPEPYIGKGRYACADIGIEERIRPGETISERSQWDGRSGFGLAPSPAGPVTLTSAFSYFWRGKGEPASITDQVIRLTIPSWVVNGRDRSLLDPGEVVDAALDSPQFAAWLPTVRIGDGNQTVLRYDAMADRWEVGILVSRASAFHVVPVDPATGFVGPFIDRAWDPRVDGNP